MKPDWKDAPDWAKYLAQDRDGTWLWSEGELKPSTDGEWKAVNTFLKIQEMRPPRNAKWRKTLEKRP